MDQSKIVKKYTKGDVTVVWEPAKCIHSGICVRGLSSVFNPKEKPWIDMEGADNQAIIDQVGECPSGALSILNSEMNEATSDTQVKIIHNGPLIIEGEIKMTKGDETVVLKNKKTSFCRCGASSNKPFCDGTHKGMNYED